MGEFKHAKVPALVPEVKVVNVTFIFHHHSDHGNKVSRAQNQIEPEEYIVHSVGKLFKPLALLFLVLEALQEAHHLPEQLSLTLRVARVNHADVWFGFCWGGITRCQMD